MSKVCTPGWVALAVAEHLSEVWFDGIGKDEAFQSATEAFRDVLGWGTSGKRGLHKLPGYKDSSTCWRSTVRMFELDDSRKRASLGNNHVLPHCRREGIALEGGDTLLAHFAKVQDWGSQQLTLRPLADVSAF